MINPGVHVNPGYTLKLGEDRKGLGGGLSGLLHGAWCDPPPCLGQVYLACALRDSWAFPLIFVITHFALDCEPMRRSHPSCAILPAPMSLAPVTGPRIGPEKICSLRYESLTSRTPLASRACANTLPRSPQASLHSLYRRASKDSEELNSCPQGHCTDYLCCITNYPMTEWLPTTTSKISVPIGQQPRFTWVLCFRVSRWLHARSWSEAVVSFQGSTRTGSAFKLSHVAVGKIQFLTGCRTKGLVSLLAGGQRSPTLISLPCGHLQHGSLLHQSTQAEKEREKASKKAAIAFHSLISEGTCHDLCRILFFRTESLGTA